MCREVEGADGHSKWGQPLQGVLIHHIALFGLPGIKFSKELLDAVPRIHDRVSVEEALHPLPKGLDETQGGRRFLFCGNLGANRIGRILFACGALAMLAQVKGDGEGTVEALDRLDGVPGQSQGGQGVP